MRKIIDDLDDRLNSFDSVGSLNCQNGNQIINRILFPNGDGSAIGQLNVALRRMGLKKYCLYIDDEEAILRLLDYIENNYGDFVQRVETRLIPLLNKDPEASKKIREALNAIKPDRIDWYRQRVSKLVEENIIASAKDKKEVKILFLDWGLGVCTLAIFVIILKMVGWYD